MPRRYSPVTYWCAEVTGSTGKLSELGYAPSFPALMSWLAENLEKLPEGRARIVKKDLDK